MYFISHLLVVFLYREIHIYIESVCVYTLYIVCTIDYAVYQIIDTLDAHVQGSGFMGFGLELPEKLIFFNGLIALQLYPLGLYWSSRVWAA